MANGIFSVTLEDLKQQTDEFGLKGKDRTKFLKEEWRKIQDAKVEKERFEKEAEERRLEKETEQKRLEMEEKRLKRELEAKLHSEKLAAQLELERLSLERAKMEREIIDL